MVLDHVGQLEWLAGVQRGTHLDAGRLQCRILRTAKQRGRCFFADLGIGRPYDGISRPSSIEHAAMASLRGPRAFQHFRSEESAEAAALMGGKHLGAAAIDRGSAGHPQHAID